MINITGFGQLIASYRRSIIKQQYYYRGPELTAADFPQGELSRLLPEIAAEFRHQKPTGGISCSI